MSEENKTVVENGLELNPPEKIDPKAFEKAMLDNEKSKQKVLSPNEAEDVAAYYWKQFYPLFVNGVAGQPIKVLKRILVELMKGSDLDQKVKTDFFIRMNKLSVRALRRLLVNLVSNTLENSGKPSISKTEKEAEELGLMVLDEKYTKRVFNDGAPEKPKQDDKKFGENSLILWADNLLAQKYVMIVITHLQDENYMKMVAEKESEQKESKSETTESGS